MKIDFVDLAKYCQTEYKESINRSKGEKYDKTLFVAISEDDTISVSSTPHILSDANKCILNKESGKWLLKTGIYGIVCSLSTKEVRC